MKSLPLIIRIALALFYIGFAFYVWITRSFVIQLSETNAFLLGGVLFAYGLFRGYMVYLDSKKRP